MSVSLNQSENLRNEPQLLMKRRGQYIMRMNGSFEKFNLRLPGGSVVKKQSASARMGDSQAVEQLNTCASAVPPPTGRPQKPVRPRAQLCEGGVGPQ